MTTETRKSQRKTAATSNNQSWRSPDSKLERDIAVEILNFVAMNYDHMGLPMNYCEANVHSADLMAQGIASHLVEIAGENPSRLSKVTWSQHVKKACRKAFVEVTADGGSVLVRLGKNKSFVEGVVNCSWWAVHPEAKARDFAVKFPHLAGDYAAAQH